MLGTFRFCLALLVALSHNGVEIKGLNPGVVAVVGFYLVSGYVMTGLVRIHYATLGQVGAFYVDRALRLMPHYLVIAGITLVWTLWKAAPTEYLTVAPSPLRILENVIVVPLNYYMFNHADEFTLIPPAWSLGAEIQFYILAPFLLVRRTVDFRLPALAVSALIYVIASSGVINSDWFGYRLLSGVLFVFMLGSILYDIHQRRDARARSWSLVAIVVASAAILAGILAREGKIALPYDRETLLGLAGGMVALNGLARLGRHWLDDALGNISYGIFLNHFLVRWTIFGGEVSGFAKEVAYLGAATIVAVTLFSLVERPVADLRRKIRRSQL